MGPVKNQNLARCKKSCWAFASTGLVEGQLNVFKGNVTGVNLEEMDITDFYGCNDNSIDAGLSYIMYQKAKSKIGEFPNLEGVRWGYSSDFMPDGIDEIILALQNGPVAGVFEVFNDFEPFFAQYPTGIYRKSPTAQTTGYGHAIVIVSYDEDQQYWLCKNSWGDGWGDGGYFKIGFGECLIETYENWAIMVNESNFAKIVPNLIPNLSTACNYSAENNEKIYVYSNISLAENAIENTSNVHIVINNGANLNLGGFYIFNQGGSITVAGGVPSNFAMATIGGVGKGLFPSVQSALDNTNSSYTVALPVSYPLQGNILWNSGANLIINDGLNFNGYNILGINGVVQLSDNVNVNCAYIKDGNILKGLSPTINSAINYAPAGYTVELQPRTYNETISITGKNSINISGTNNSSTLSSGISLTSCQGVNISNLTSNQQITTNNCYGNISITNVTFPYSSYATDYGSDAVSLIETVAQNGGASLGYRGYGGVTYFVGNTIETWDAGIDLNSYAYADVATGNLFCGNGYDVSATGGAYAFIRQNQHSRALSSSVYGNVDTGDGSMYYTICSRQMGNKRASNNTEIASLSVSSKNEFSRKYLDLLKKKLSKDEKGENDAEILSFINKMKTELENVKDKETFRNYLSIIVRLSRAMKSESELNNYLLTLQNDKKSSSYAPYVKKYSVWNEVKNKSYQSAISIANELLKIKEIDTDLTCEMLYEKGLIYKHYMKDKQAAFNAFSEIISNYKEHPLARYAEDQLDASEKENAKQAAIKINTDINSSDFTLNNYPNPFNPSTKINFTVSGPGNVKLTVYNMLGQKVADLLDEFNDKGSYTINFDASKLASGLYVYTLQAGNKTISNKMFLLK